MLNILFPRLCCGCDSILSMAEDLVCVVCRHEIPLNRIHSHSTESLKKKFYGRVPLENATALIQFQKGGLTQRLMHQMKYHGYKELSDFFGKWRGEELQSIPSYGDIQYVIPVPLHKQKLKKRGYNQVEGFGRTLAAYLNASYRDDILIKDSKTASQVFKNRILRFDIEEVFRINNIEEIQDSHVLLVDDIITTGATLERCATELLKAKNVKLSIATIALSA